MTAARGFRFDPGRYGGKPVPVEITFTQKFLPRARPPAPGGRPTRPKRRTGPALTAVLRGRLVQLGTRRPLAAAAVIAAVRRPALPDRVRRQRALSPAAAARRRARVGLRVGAPHLRAAGDARGPARAGGDLPRRARTLQPQRDRRRRRAAARRGLAHHAARRRDPEDPGHVRRSVPRRSRRCPAWRRSCRCCRSRSCAARARARRASCSTARASRCCFTCWPGPASSTPSSSTRSSSSPAARPRRTAATWAASSTAAPRRARPDERLLDFDANLLQAGGFVRAADQAARRDGDGGRALRIPGVPARPRDQRGVALVLGLPAAARRRHAAPTAGRSSCSARATSSTRRRPTAMPNDPNPPLEPSLILGFHRLDLRLNLTQGRLSETFRAVLGYDRTLSQRHRLLGAGPPSRRSRRRGPRAASCGSSAACDGTFRRPPPGRGGAADGEPVLRDHVVARNDSTSGRRTWRRSGGRRPTCSSGPACAPTSTRTTTATKPAVDPRLTRALPPVRARICPAASPPADDDSAVWLKAQRRHLPPAAAVRAPAARPRPDAAQVRPPALVPDQRSAPRSRCARRLRSRSRASSTTWTRRSSICRSTRRRSSTDRQPHDPADERSSCRRRGPGVHRSPHRAADRPRVRSRGAAAPAGEDRPLRLDLVHALALRAVPRRRRGCRTTSIARTSSTSSRGCRCAATGTSACACSTRAASPPRRPPATTPRARHGLLSLRLSRRQARRLAQLAARLLRRRHQRRAPPRGGPAGRGPALRPAHRRRARPVRDRLVRRRASPYNRRMHMMAIAASAAVMLVAAVPARAASDTAQIKATFKAYKRSLLKNTAPRAPPSSTQGRSDDYQRMRDLQSSGAAAEVKKLSPARQAHGHPDAAADPGRRAQGHGRARRAGSRRRAGLDRQRRAVAELGAIDVDGDQASAAFVIKVKKTPIKISLRREKAPGASISDRCSRWQRPRSR